MLRRLAPLLALVLAAGCASSGAPGGDQPLAYDPPGSTRTEDKPITPQHRRTITFRDSGVWASNEFEGARLNDFYQEDESTYVAVIRPENAPINMSPWYAFQLGAPTPRTIRVRLTYEDGRHRYVPKLSRDGDAWTPVTPASYAPDTSAGTATLRLRVGPDTLWVAGQELITSEDFADWTAALAAKPYVERTVLGRSRQGRPLYQLAISENADAADHVLVISRQHPPEVTGTLAVMAFLETIAADTDLARRFRQRFAVLAVPLMNPDGVDRGHWRHNTGGVDLNRDWLHFNQPETRLVAEHFRALTDDPENRVLFGLDFHSTQQDVFYTLSRDLPTTPPGFIDAWLDALRTRFPDYHVNDDPSGLGSPVSKNWFYETFGAPPVTYEVGDETDRALIRRIATGAAEAMMELLLETPGGAR